MSTNEHHDEQTTTHEQFERGGGEGEGKRKVRTKIELQMKMEVELSVESLKILI